MHLDVNPYAVIAVTGVIGKASHPTGARALISLAFDRSGRTFVTWAQDGGPMPVRSARYQFDRLCRHLTALEASRAQGANFAGGAAA